MHLRTTPSPPKKNGLESQQNNALQIPFFSYAIVAKCLIQKNNIDMYMEMMFITSHLIVVPSITLIGNVHTIAIRCFFIVFTLRGFVVCLGLGLIVFMQGEKVAAIFCYCKGCEIVEVGVGVNQGHFNLPLLLCCLSLGELRELDVEC
jgi:hypothetical protein